MFYQHCFSEHAVIIALTTVTVQLTEMLPPVSWISLTTPLKSSNPAPRFKTLYLAHYLRWFFFSPDFSFLRSNVHRERVT